MDAGVPDDAVDFCSDAFTAEVPGTLVAGNVVVAHPRSFSIDSPSPEYARVAILYAHDQGTGAHPVVLARLIPF